MEVITMTTIITTGRITRDFELRKAEKTSCVYANFSLAVNDGFGSNQKTMYYECAVFGVDAERLIKAKAKKGSLIQVTGKFGVSEFTRTNGETGYSLKITVLAWSYIPVASGGNSNGNSGAESNITPVPNQASETYYPEVDYNGTTNLDDDLPF